MLIGLYELIWGGEARRKIYINPEYIIRFANYKHGVYIWLKEDPGIIWIEGTIDTVFDKIREAKNKEQEDGRNGSL